VCRACGQGLRLRSNSVCRSLTVISLILLNSNAFVVCLLDDDPSVLKGLGRLFASADLLAETFSDPEEFLRYARTHRPMIALIDVHMPQMNGLEVQSQLREVSPSTRVIIFTGKDDPLVRSTALNAGASAFFTKPFDDEAILTAVRLAFASAT
jgi:FixJ family two-component response regulator